MISIRKVSKRFGRREAVNNLSLEVPEGTVYGLLGHNGAGKSTTIGMLLGHLAIDEGEIFINAVSVIENRALAIRRVGALFEAPAFYPYLSGRRNLEAFTAYSARIGRKELEETVELVGLEHRIDDRVQTYSHGMRTRLALAQALLPRPDVLILDEPSDGLDPEGIHEMRQLIQRFNQEFKLTILLSSHLLSEVEQICHQIGIIRQGVLLFNGNWREALSSTQRYQLSIDPIDDAFAKLKKSPFIRYCEIRKGIIEIELKEEAQIDSLVASLIQSNLRISAVIPAHESLESFYLKTLAQGAMQHAKTESIR